MIRKIAPPILLDGVRSVRTKLSGSRRSLPVWEYIPEGWARQASDPSIGGWDVPAIRDWHRERFRMWSEAYDAPYPLGASEYASDPTKQHLHSHNVHVSMAYVLALASRGRSNLSILDWGGGIGQHYLLARSVLPDIELSYHCKDLPLVCEAGRELLPQVVFSEDESCFEREYDFVLASSSLQYREDWRALLGHLAAVTTEYLYIAQMPFVARTASFVAVQRPYAHGYETEYLGWVLNRDEFLGAASSIDLELAREFFFDNTISVSGVAEPAVHRGFLLRRRSAAASVA